MCPRCLTRPPWRRRSCRPPTRSPRPCGGWRLSDDSAPSPDRSPPVGTVPEGRLMATTRVVMPQLGESVHEGMISKWLVKPGDKVVEFEPMLEVDTDKVSAEVPAPVTGILKEILAKEGQTVQAGAEIAVVELAAAGEAANRSGDGKVTATPEAAPSPTKVGAQIEREERVHAAPGAQGRGEGQTTEPAPAVLETGEHRYSPAVQMVADELKVDLSGIHGTGLGGRVTKKDVQEFAAKAKQAPAPTSAQAPRAAPAEGDEVVQLTRVRRLIAENMVRSKTTIPHAWQTQEADMSGVVASRSASKAAFQKQEGFSLTYLPYVMAAAISALREHRHVNATFNETELIVHRDINLGISVGLEDTLVV